MCKAWSSGAIPFPSCPMSWFRRKAASQADSHRSRYRDRRDVDGRRLREGGRHHRARPHAPRYRPQASRRRPARDRSRAPTAVACRSLPAVRASPSRRCRPRISPISTAGELSHRFALARQRSQGSDREDPLRHLDRGDALLSQWHLSARGRSGGELLRAVATDGHRLAQAKCRGPRAPRACRASSCRARPCSNCASSSRTRPARSKSRSREPRSGSRSTPGSDLEADRRHLSRL